MSSQRTVQLKGKKVLVPEADRSPNVRPTFANHVQIVQIGTDVYLDFGVIDIDAALGALAKGEAEPEAAKPEVTFFAVGRIAMSVNTFADLRAKVNEVFTKLRDKELLDEAYHLDEPESTPSSV